LGAARLGLHVGELSSEHLRRSRPIQRDARAPERPARLTQQRARARLARVQRRALDVDLRRRHDRLRAACPISTG